MSQARAKRIAGSAALLAAFVAAPAAGAQLLRAEPVLERAVEAPLIPSDTAQAAAARNVLRPDARISLSSRSFTEEDGSVLVRRGLIGSWALSSGLEAGIGLFAVSGDSRKHNEFKRSWSAKDVTPKNGNIAAIGMKLRF